MRTIFISILVVLFSSVSSFAANDFSSCTATKAVWSVDNGALTTDSKGTNTLTDNNTVQTDTVNFKEGDAAADLELGNGEYFNITDANLDSGFPLKSGETNDDFTVCLWVKLESVSGFLTLVSKWDRSTGSGNSFQIRNRDGDLELFIGYNNGASFEQLVDATFTITADEWHHVCASFNNTTKAYEMRLYEETPDSASSATGTATNNISIRGTDFLIGAALSNGSAERNFDGLIDEMVVFDEKLSATDMDSIRGGTYSCAGGTTTTTTPTTTTTTTSTTTSTTSTTTTTVPITTTTTTSTTTSTSTTTTTTSTTTTTLPGGTTTTTLAGPTTTTTTSTTSTSTTSTTTSTTSTSTSTTSTSTSTTTTTTSTTTTTGPTTTTTSTTTTTVPAGTYYIIFTQSPP